MKKRYKVLSVILLLLTGINAVVAGILFILDPSGSKMGMSVSYLQYSPFTSFFVPGIILLVMNGLLNIAAVIAAIRGLKYYPVFITFQGLVLCAWIIVQMLLVRDVNLLHVIMLTIGILLSFFGAQLMKK